MFSRFIARLSEGQKSAAATVPAFTGSVTASHQEAICEDFFASDMLGREENLAQLNSWLQKALSGQRQTVFVTGEAGIGKTTLVESFCETSARSFKSS